MGGSEKLKPLMVEKSTKVRCFKKILLPMIYQANKKTWITTELFSEWLCSLALEMKRQNRKILLFVDN